MELSAEQQAIWDQFSKPTTQEEIYERAEQIQTAKQRDLTDWSQSIFDACDDLKPKQ